MSLLNNLKIGVIGGSKGLGSWLVRYLGAYAAEVRFTSTDDLTQFHDNQSLVAWADVVFLAVPIPHMLPVMTEIYPHLSGKVLVEVCSVKKFLIEGFERLQQTHPEVAVEFLSIHPMFSQSIRQLKGQVILFTHSANDKDFAAALRTQFAHDKAQLYDMDYLRHDQIMGVVQGLNHFNVFASASTLTRMSGQLGHIKDFSSPPYRIFLIFFSRYILQDPRLYADIQMYNEFVPETLRIFRQEVDRLYELILKKDRDGFIEYAQQARAYFEENQEDTGISNHLIEQLGVYLNKLKNQRPDSL